MINIPFSKIFCCQKRVISSLNNCLCTTTSMYFNRDIETVYNGNNLDRNNLNGSSKH